jgi:hypothetical protein
MKIRTAARIEQIYNEVYGCGDDHADEELAFRLKAAGITKVESESVARALADEARVILNGEVSASPAPTTIPAGLPAIRKALEDICKAYITLHLHKATIRAIRRGQMVLDQNPEMVCAWCHPNDHRPGITHGICEKHAEEFGDQLAGMERMNLVI